MKEIFFCTFCMLTAILLIYKITGVLLIPDVKIGKIKVSFKPINIRNDYNEKPR